jgi:hypothetical protein
MRRTATATAADILRARGTIGTTILVNAFTASALALVPFFAGHTPGALP